MFNPNKLYRITPEDGTRPPRSPLKRKTRIRREGRGPGKWEDQRPRVPLIELIRAMRARREADPSFCIEDMDHGPRSNYQWPCSNKIAGLWARIIDPSLKENPKAHFLIWELAFGEKL